MDYQTLADGFVQAVPCQYFVIAEREHTPDGAGYCIRAKVTPSGGDIGQQDLKCLFDQTATCSETLSIIDKDWVCSEVYDGHADAECDGQILCMRTGGKFTILAISDSELKGAIEDLKKVLENGSQ